MRYLTTPRTIAVAVAICVGVLLQGCTSVSYGPMTVRSIGSDMAFDDAQWLKTGPDGSSEMVVIHHAKRNASESTHTVANAALAITGAIVGSPAGVPGAAAGAAIGGGSGEILQTVRDWFNKDSSNTNAVAK